MARAPRTHCLATGACTARGPGHCRHCAAQLIRHDPAWQDRVRAAARKREEDPAFRARRNRAAAINGRKAIAQADRAKGGATRSRLALGWLPADRRDEYHRLRRDLGAAEARRILREDIHRLARRAAEQILVDMQVRDRQRRGTAT